MRLILCLLILISGVPDVYAGDSGDKFEANPHYWNLLDGLEFDPKLDTSPDIVAQHIRGLLKADIMTMIKFGQRLRIMDFEDRNPELENEEYIRISGHLLLILKHLQDAKFIALCGDSVFLGLGEELKSLFSSKVIEHATAPEFTNAYGVELLLSRQGCFAAYLLLALWDVLEPIHTPRVVLYSFHRPGIGHFLFGSSMGEDLDEQLWFNCILRAFYTYYWTDRSEEEKERFLRSQDSLIESEAVQQYITRETAFQLLSYKFIRREGLKYKVPSMEMTWRLLHKLTPEDIHFFMQHTTPGLSAVYLETELGFRQDPEQDLPKFLLKKYIEELQNHVDQQEACWYLETDDIAMQYVKCLLQFIVVEALMAVVDAFKKSISGDLKNGELLKAFGSHMRTCVDFPEYKKQFEHYDESEVLVELAGSYLSRTKNLKLEEVQIFFELVKGSRTCGRGMLYKIYLGRTQKLDPEIVSFLLKRFREQDYKYAHLWYSAFIEYLKQTELQWDAQAEDVFRTLDQVYAHSNYGYVYASYFHRLRNWSQKIELNERFAKALFGWIIKMDQSRKSEVLTWVFSVWGSGFDAERFCQIYGWYLETEPPKADVDHVHKEFCKCYATEFDFQRTKYAGLADDPRTQDLFQRALECRREQERKNEEDRRKWKDLMKATDFSFPGSVNEIEEN